MTVVQYLQVLRDRWLVVLALTLLATAGAAGFAYTQTPVYEADAQLFVSTSGQKVDASDLTAGSTFTQQRVKSYSQLVTSPSLLGQVVRNLGLPYTPEVLAGNVKASSPLDTVLIDITVNDTSAIRARDIANEIAGQFPRLVDSLETPRGQANSPIRVSVTRAATVPLAPVSPKKTLDLALGLLVGLGLGVGVAVLLDTLDRSVTSRHQATQLVGAPALGLVNDDAEAARKPLITQDAFSARAEAFRQLRTNIRFLSVDHQVRSLVVTSSLPDEGKTSTAANLAIVLAQNGERVILIDADLRRPSLAELFGLPSGVGLTTVLMGDLGPNEAMHPWRDELPLSVLVSGPVPPNPSELIGSSRMQELVQELTATGATVVIDSPPLLPVTDGAVLARITDGAVLVTRAGSTRTDHLATAAESLRAAGATILGLVLNRVPKRGRSSAYAGYGYGGYSPAVGDVQSGAAIASAGRRAAQPEGLVGSTAGAVGEPVAVSGAGRPIGFRAWSDPDVAPPAGSARTVSAGTVAERRLPEELRLPEADEPASSRSGGGATAATGPRKGPRHGARGSAAGAQPQRGIFEEQQYPASPGEPRAPHGGFDGRDG